jgi:hypothetical protein
MAIADESQADKAAVRAVVARASAAQSDPDEFLPLHTHDANVAYTMVRIGDEWLISHAQTTPVLG